MKKSNKNKPKAKVVKELAGQFEEEINKNLPVSIQPDGSLVYKDFFIKRNKLENWVVYHRHNGNPIEEYYLKSCALMAAKAYSRTDINKFFEIKNLDNKYWASYSDNQVYRKNIKTAKDFDRFQVLLNKLELSQQETDRFKDKISTMFKWSFV